MSNRLNIWLGGGSVNYPKSAHPWVKNWRATFRRFVREKGLDVSEVLVKDSAAYSFDTHPLAMQDCHVVVVNLRKLPKSEAYKTMLELGCAYGLLKMILVITDKQTLEKYYPTVKLLKALVAEDMDSALKYILAMPDLVFARKS